MLPGRVYVARGYLPPGEHRISINGRMLEEPIRIDGQYALVPLRIYHNGVITGKVASLGQLPAMAATPAPQPPALTTTETTRKSTKTTTTRSTRTTSKTAPAAVAPKAAAQ